MSLQDLYVTPLVILAIYLGAYLIRGKVSDNFTKRYFLPALTVKIIGALAVGLIYQFYYAGGDTYNFYYFGTRHIYSAFNDSLGAGIKMILADGNYDPTISKYAFPTP